MLEDQEYRDHVVGSLSRLETLIVGQNERLWGGPNGQPGVIPHMYGQIETNKKEMDDEFKKIAEKQNAFDKAITVTTWKLGTMSAAAGALCTFAAQWVGKKLFHV